VREVRDANGTERANPSENIQSSLRRKNSDEKTPHIYSSLPKILEKNKSFA
jgi:hypothetical protein